MRLLSLRHPFLFLTVWFWYCFSFTIYAVELPFIEVITSDLYPVTGIKALQQQGLSVKVYNLDDSKRLVEEIGKHLPNNQNAAKNVLQQRFKKMGDKQVKAQFIRAYQAVTLSTQYALTGYPAVVFNHGQSVIYGVTDLNQAVYLYRLWQKQQ